MFLNYDYFLMQSFAKTQAMIVQFLNEKNKLSCYPDLYMISCLYDQWTLFIQLILKVTCFASIIIMSFVYGKHTINVSSILMMNQLDSCFVRIYIILILFFFKYVKIILVISGNLDDNNKKICNCFDPFLQFQNQNRCISIYNFLFFLLLLFSKHTICCLLIYAYNFPFHKNRKDQISPRI